MNSTNTASLRSVLLGAFFLGSHLIGTAAGWTPPDQPAQRLFTDDRLKLESALSDRSGGTVAAAISIIESDPALPRQVRLQRLDSAGIPLWGDNGILLNEGDFLLNKVEVVESTDGGFLVAWGFRGAGEFNNRIRVQKVSAGGEILWTPGGVALALETAYGREPLDLQPAEDGGVYAAGQSVLRLTASGAVAPGWPAEGVSIGSVPDAGQLFMAAAPDGVVLAKVLTTIFNGVYAQGSVSVARVTSGGALIPLREIPLDTSRWENVFDAAGDGKGGIYLNSGRRRSVLSTDPSAPVDFATEYLVRYVTPAGLLGWDETRAVISVNTTRVWAEDMIADGAGGVIVLWSAGDDYGEGPFDALVGQRISPSGVRVWGESPRVLWDNASFQLPEFAADGSGGFLAVAESRSDDKILQLRRFDGAGLPLWGSEGRAIAVPARGRTLVLASATGGGVLLAQTEVPIPFNSTPGGVISGRAFSPRGDIVPGPGVALGGRFANISTRGLVTREVVLIGGFVVAEGSQQILIKANGPSLERFGVAGLRDPILRIFRGAEVIATSDNWEDSGRDAILEAVARTGALPPGAAQDAAIVLTLPEGAYTAQVSSADGTSGEVLFEAFEVR